MSGALAQKGFNPLVGSICPVILRLYSRNTSGAIGLGVSIDQIKAISDLGADLAVELETDEKVDIPCGERGFRVRG